MGRSYSNGKRKKTGKGRKRKRRAFIPEDRYINKNVRDKARKRDHNRCVYCNRRDRSLRMDGLRPRRVKLEFGHQIPHSKGGDKCIKNIQMECKKCNRSKGAKVKDVSWFTDKILQRGADGCRRHK